MHARAVQVFVLFMMQGQQVVDNVGKVARVAVPMAAYFCILWFSTFAVCRAAGVRYGHAVTQARPPRARQRRALIAPLPSMTLVAAWSQSPVLCCDRAYKLERTVLTAARMGMCRPSRPAATTLSWRSLWRSARLGFARRRRWRPRWGP